MTNVDSKAPPIELAGKVFITGANGFIGRAVARRCRELGAQVSGLDFKADEEWGIVAGDLTKPASWKQLLQGVDLVIHTAAIVSNTAPMDLAWDINVKATAGLLDHCIEAGVGRFVQLSSIAAYGFAATKEVDERQPLRPMGNTYVDTKIAGEHLVLACHASGTMDCTIIRPGDVYGPGSRPWVILPLEMIKSGKFMLPAQGQGLFSPVYIDDIVNGILLAATRQEGAGQIFNISGGITPTCEDFFGHYVRMASAQPPRMMSTGVARLLAELLRFLITVFGGSTEVGGGAIDMLSRRAGYSIGKADRMLGYSPQVGLEEGMRRTEMWAREQGLV
ncbi:MAG: NAD(P)-dependent oxidoreductase [Halieaceae bacterium]|jgi:nucleoside-diphosphate-sugar epimerase|nr:NAD(P)-dependent oxidoreductase [Halieaceae bacterium]